MTTVNDFKNRSGKWVKSYKVNNTPYNTKSASTWWAMRARCKPKGWQQNNKPTYIGCETSPNFKDFQYFADWCQEQIGYNLDDYHLDKDILLKNNKLYSENTCVFVPRQLNSFLGRGPSSKYPQGVYRQHNTEKFMVRVNIDGKYKCFGNFTTVEDAYAVYKKDKEAKAYHWHEKLRDGEFVVDPRVIERMRTWTLD